MDTPPSGVSKFEMDFPGRNSSEPTLLLSSYCSFDENPGHITLTATRLSFVPLLGIQKRINVASIIAMNVVDDREVQLKYTSGAGVNTTTVTVSFEETNSQFVSSLEELLAVQRGDVSAASVAPSDESSFFTITNVRGTQKIVYDMIGFVGFQSCTVSHPFAVSAAEYIVYAVQCELSFHRMEEPRETLVYHRYSHFEALDAKIRRLVDDKLDSLTVVLPAFPPKPWIPVGQFGAEWLRSRCRKLGTWLGKLVAVPELTADPDYLQPILDFVGSGELWEPAAHEGESDASGPSSASRVFARIFEKGVYGVNSALGKLLDDRDPPSGEEDYKYVRSVFEGQGLKPRKVPWNKFVVSLCGTTSSGKSSFVSHLFTLACVTSSGAGQVDTGFSIVETVSEEEFRKYAPDTVGAFPQFSEAQLKTNVPSSSNAYSDPRYGCVFVYLDSAATLNRYREQLESQRDQLLEFEKIRTVLVNERYLNGTPEQIDVAKRLIIVDSKGVDATTLGGSSAAKTEDSLTYMQREISTFQYFCKISALTLFFLPAADIRNCEPAITVFELALVCSKDGLSFLKKEIKKRAVTTMPDSASAVDPFSGLVGRMLGVDQIYGMAKWVGDKVTNILLLDKNGQDIEHGNARWEKTFFILSKADEVFHGQGPTDSKQSESQMYYELGMAFGRRLHYLQPPTFSKCFMLGLPEKQAPQQEPYTGALDSFKVYLQKQCSGAKYDRSRDESIVSMCDILESTMGNGWVMASWYSTVLPYIRAAKRRSQDRLYSL